MRDAMTHAMRDGYALLLSILIFSIVLFFLSSFLFFFFFFFFFFRNLLYSLHNAQQSVLEKRGRRDVDCV